MVLELRGTLSMGGDRRLMYGSDRYGGNTIVLPSTDFADKVGMDRGAARFRNWVGDGVQGGTDANAVPGA